MASWIKEQHARDERLDEWGVPLEPTAAYGLDGPPDPEHPIDVAEWIKSTETRALPAARAHSSKRVVTRKGARQGQSPGATHVTQTAHNRNINGMSYNDFNARMASVQISSKEPATADPKVATATSASRARPTVSNLSSSTRRESAHFKSSRRAELLETLETRLASSRQSANSSVSKLQLDQLALLQYCVIPSSVLGQYPFVTTQLTPQELIDKRKCERCKKFPRYIGKSLDPPKKDVDTLFCKHHRGCIVGRQWSCCHGSVGYSQGCTASKYHLVKDVSIQQLTNTYQFEITPRIKQGNKDTSTVRAAVAIDCEMGTSMNGESELIRLSVIDFDNGSVLLDTLVCPSVPMAHYNTRYSGVSAAQMEAAKRNRTCLQGTRAAREAVLRWVGPETIVIGHSVWNDFEALRWIHTGGIVDTNVLEDKFDRRQKALWQPIEADMIARECSKDEIAVRRLDFVPDLGLPKGTGLCGLKGATLRRLNRHIQVGKGHCSLEDAIASRDLAVWHMTNADLFDYIW